jgi:hypothetical protein
MLWHLTEAIPRDTIPKLLETDSERGKKTTMSPRALTFTTAACCALVGCVSTSSVLNVGRDTYSVSATADGFRTAASARESAYEAGQAKCGKEGKRFQMIHESSERTRMNIDTTITVTFRCLDDRDADYRRVEIQNSPAVVIEDRRK